MCSHGVFTWKNGNLLACVFHSYIFLFGFNFFPYLYEILKFLFQDTSSEVDLIFLNYVGWKIKEQNASKNLVNHFVVFNTTILNFLTFFTLFFFLCSFSSIQDGDEEQRPKLLNLNRGHYSNF